MARRDFPANKRLTAAEIERMQDLLAMGPLTYRPEVDDGLMDKRWAEVWEPGRLDLGIGAVGNAARMFYDDRGRVRGHWVRRGGAA